MPTVAFVWTRRTGVEDAVGGIQWALDASAPDITRRVDTYRRSRNRRRTCIVAVPAVVGVAQQVDTRASAFVSPVGTAGLALAIHTRNTAATARTTCLSACICAAHAPLTGTAHRNIFRGRIHGDVGTGVSRGRDIPGADVVWFRVGSAIRGGSIGPASETGRHRDRDERRNTESLSTSGFHYFMRVLKNHRSLRTRTSYAICDSTVAVLAEDQPMASPGECVAAVPLIVFQHHELHAPVPIQIQERVTLRGELIPAHCRQVVRQRPR